MPAISSCDEKGKRKIKEKRRKKKKDE